MQKWFIALLVFFALGCASADTYSTPKPGHWLLESTFLYWSQSPIPGLAGESVLDFIIVNGAPPSAPGATNNGIINKNLFGYNPGFRIAGTYAFSKSDFLALLRWTQIKPSRERTVAGPYLIPFNTSPLGLGPYSGSALSNNYGKYQNGELLIGKTILDQSPINMSLYMGLNYLHSDIITNTRYQSATTVQFNRNHLWLNGLGPEFYIDNYIKLMTLKNGQLSMRGSMQAGFIVVRGPVGESYEITNGIINTDFKTQVDWIVDPSFDLRLGLGYDAEVGKGIIGVQAGYEFLTYNIVSAHGPFVTLRIIL
ncbi:Lpg1974 family pore-forming outer membrane protein [Legionella quateirensis]|uniref:Major outer membrane protein n=1 Tax=Legionella quateirensis TaxID=45072 RepID=A0A378KVZ0_9GAMM|nr:Lpg1974 family pore-forming outer membrane protein [Legionella quateirensis]KTD48331.1 hypothetical protein Lqua_1860 [Legionella quateirensis]STY18339.1 Uncharacterised protein [Legionella quateirensis]